MNFMQTELVEKKLLGSLVDKGVTYVGTYFASSYYGVGGYVSSGVSLAIAKLLFYFGSKAIPCNDAEEILKTQCAVVNARELSKALHSERWKA